MLSVRGQLQDDRLHDSMRVQDLEQPNPERPGRMTGARGWGRSSLPRPRFSLGRWRSSGDGGADGWTTVWRYFTPGNCTLEFDMCVSLQFNKKEGRTLLLWGVHVDLGISSFLSLLGNFTDPVFLTLCVWFALYLHNFSFSSFRLVIKLHEASVRMLECPVLFFNLTFSVFLSVPFIMCLNLLTSSKISKSMTCNSGCQLYLKTGKTKKKNPKQKHNPGHLPPPQDSPLAFQEGRFEALWVR